MLILEIAAGVALAPVLFFAARWALVLVVAFPMHAGIGAVCIGSLVYALATGT
jgi:hypothetical protein